jgi:hypothetical protein
MTISLAQNAARVSYSVSEGATQTSFTVSFEFFDDADLNVYVDGTKKTLTTHYSVSGGSGSTGAVAISVTGATGGSTVVITRDIALARTTDFPTSGSFQISTLNTELDRFTAIAADLKDSVDRSLQLTDYDSAVSLVLPAVADRKGKVLAFNASTGAVEAGASVSAVQSVADNAAAVNLLGTAAVVEDMGLLATSAVIEDMGLLGTAAVVEDMGLLATSAVIEDMGLLATSAVIEDMGLLGTSANVTAMGLLGNSTVITNMSNLSASAVIADMAILGTTDVVADMNTLATSDIVSDMNTLATSANVTAMGLLGTSAVVEDMGFLGTAAVVEDMGILGTSANVTAMSNVSGSISNVNTVASNISGVNDFAARYRVGSSDPSSNNDDGDLFYNTTSDALKVYNAGASAWQDGVSLGSTPTFTSQTTGQINNTDAFPDIRPSLLLDFANSKTLDPRITFTRGSTATYYDGKTTAKAEENLLTYSQEFDNSGWTKQAASITANQLAAPDGTTTADLFTADGSSAQHVLSEGSLTFTADNYVFSIFAKKGTNDFFQIRFNSNAGGGRANFDLNNGTTGGVNGVTATITDVGNGWYRCTAMEAASATTSGGIQMSLIGALTDGSIPTNTLSTTVYFWGAQLEQRSSATAYTPTTSAPIVKYQPTLQTAASGAARFDHSPTTGESKGLLIEEARTNLATHSKMNESLDNISRGTVFANSIIAPDGTQTANIYREDTANGAHHIQEIIPNETANTVHTASVYLKNYGVSDVSLNMRISDSGDVYKKVFFDLDNIVVSFSGDAGYTGTITDVGNGWRRCTITGDVGDGTNDLRVHVFSCQGTGTVSSYTGNGWDGLGFWGLQVEVGSFATSYIATAGSTATRAADAAQVQNFDFNDGEGTVYCEGSIKFSTSAQSYARLWEITQDADANSRFNIFMNESGSDLNMGFVTQGTVYGGPTLDGSYTSGANVKTVVGYKLGENADVAEGGTLSQGSTHWTTTGTSRNRLYLGSASATSAWSNSYVRKFAYYSKLLSDATLKAMTTE